MRAYKLQVQIDGDHQVSMRLPQDFPSGPAEVIVLAREGGERKPLRLAGALAPGHGIDEVGGDPIAEALQEIKGENAALMEKRSERYR